MQEVAGSLIHNTTCHTHRLYQLQNPRRSSSCEIFDEKFHIYYNGVRDRKRCTLKKMAKINPSTLILFSHTWASWRCIQNLKTLALTEAEKSMTEKYCRNKENDMQEVADSLTHNITCHTQRLYQILKS